MPALQSGTFTAWARRRNLLAGSVPASASSDPVSGASDHVSVASNHVSDAFNPISEARERDAAPTSSASARERGGTTASSASAREREAATASSMADSPILSGARPQRAAVCARVGGLV